MEDNQKVTITEDEVFKVIQNKLKSDSFKIVEYNIDMLGEWVGLCGDHAILKVTLKPDEDPRGSETHKFFLKLYPREEIVIEFIDGTGSFKKEIFIYKLFHLFKEEEIKILDTCIPRCYLTVSKKFLVLENLIDQGYTSVNKHEFFDYDTVKVVLEALSKLHASSLIFEEKKSCRLIDTYEEEFEESYFNDSDNFPNKEGIEAAIAGILNMIKIFNFPEKLLTGKDFRLVLEQVCRKVFTLAKPSKNFRNVVSHGDIWATNVLIKRDNNGKPVKCKLVDFQCGRYTPPAQDVMSVIHLTTSRDFRQKHMYNLIGIYYTSLEKHVTLAGYDMKTIIPFDEFLSTCEEQKVFGLVQTAVYFPLILLKSDTVQDYFKNKEANKEALLVDRSLLVKEQMEKDEGYKNRIRDCIHDLKDYCDYL